MDVGKLLQKIIAQNEIIIRQNEKLLLLLAAVIIDLRGLIENDEHRHLASAELFGRR